MDIESELLFWQALIRREAIITDGPYKGERGYVFDCWIAPAKTEQDPLRYFPPCIYVGIEVRLLNIWDVPSNVVEVI